MIAIRINDTFNLSNYLYRVFLRMIILRLNNKIDTTKLIDIYDFPISSQYKQTTLMQDAVVKTLVPDQWD